MREVITFLTVPFFSQLIFGFLSWPDSSIKNLSDIFEVTVLVAYASTFIIGFPLYVSVKRSNRVNFLSLAFIGAITGFVALAVVLIVLSVFVNEMVKSSFFAPILAQAVAAGAVSGVLFWAILTVPNYFVKKN